MVTYGSKHRNMRIGTIRFSQGIYRTDNPEEIRAIESSVSFRSGAVWRVADKPPETFEVGTLTMTKGAEKLVTELGLDPTEIAQKLGTKRLTKADVQAFAGPVTEE